ncbi:MAG: hypothetical protein NDI91_16990 [Sulfuritalea sp.]|nr:hypothetical protein [Sulfuritalea sp.]
MKTPLPAREAESQVRRARLRQLSTHAILAVAGLLLAGAACAQAPAHGRYRCYELPAYTVMAWFDLAAAGISLNGDTPRPVRVDAATGRIELPRGLLPPYRHGFYLPSGAAGGDAERITIVLAARADARPGQRVWATLPRCYLTTH